MVCKWPAQAATTTRKFTSIGSHAKTLTELASTSVEEGGEVEDALEEGGEVHDILEEGREDVEEGGEVALHGS